MSSQSHILEEKCINTIRTLSIDAVQQANSGHPGTAMALAPAAYVLWTKIMRHNPKNPKWFNRDRFVLSCGHVSALIYSMLHLTGYDVSLDEIKKFRQWGSQTPGHPEYGDTPGVETTTGPLGQGVMTAVGMAMAEAHLGAVYNKAAQGLVDHYTYVFMSDGDLMEGASHEAASLAGHLGLGKLICLYDDNRITIEGETSLTCSDDVAKRFEAYGWHVIDLGDQANDLQAIEKAYLDSQQVKDKPSIIILQTHIGYGSPNRQDTAKAHGEPLGAEEIKLAKKFYGWPVEEKFLVPADVKTKMSQVVFDGQEHEAAWNKLNEEFAEKDARLAARLDQDIKRELDTNWDEAIPVFKPEDGPMATRAASGKVLNGFAAQVPNLIGGSADLAPSNKTWIQGGQYINKDNFNQRNIAWGIREHVMAAACNGMHLHGGVRPYAATFFVFTDYARPAIRLAALMKLPVIYVMTHDSIGVGEDGPTHQPIEHLASLRVMPNLHVIRPADANETAYAWRAAMERNDGPTMLVLSRQKLKVFERQEDNAASGVLKGAYVLAKEKGSAPQLILLATGSEVEIAHAAWQQLQEERIDARLVSMPCWELFMEQSESYREQVLPSKVRTRVAIEAGATFGWHQWVGEQGRIIGIDRFGASAPAKTNYQKFGLTTENIIEKVKEII
jgi:transketolase